jgi:PTS system glucitol/sorbitol-specific IIA component
MKTKVISIGGDVQELLDGGVLIMFNPNAPQELKDVAVLHEKQSDELDVLHEGGTISFGEQVFQIDFVGKEANKNFNNLGHLSVYFNNTDEDMDKLPGSIFVSSQEFSVPDIQNNQIISLT